MGRNKYNGGIIAQALVALLAEGVGRNRIGYNVIVGVPVALLAEGVGRNFNGTNNVALGDPSPSSRRAWVEILMVR